MSVTIEEHLLKKMVGLSASKISDLSDGVTSLNEILILNDGFINADFGVILCNGLDEMYFELSLKLFSRELNINYGIETSRPRLNLSNQIFEFEGGGFFIKIYNPEYSLLLFKAII